MPAAVTYEPYDKDLSNEASKEHATRMTEFQRAEAWYDGIMPDTILTKINPKTGVKVDNNVKINMFAKRVDRRRDFLFKEFPQLDLDGVPGENASEKWLRDAWKWNNAATLWGLAVLNGSFNGQVFMRILPQRQGRDRYPRAVLLNNVTTFWQADDVTTHLWYDIRYKVGNAEYRQDIVDLEAVGKGSNWGVYVYKRQDSAQDWTKIDETPWDYPLGPIVSWQHWPRASRAYGAGEFGDIALNHAVNRVYSQGNSIIRNHAFPKTITDADTKSLTESSIDGLWSVPKGSQVWNLEMQSDLSAILTFADRLDSYYNSQGRTVDISGGPAEFSNITNLAIKVGFMPQEDANEILKRQYGGAIVEASKRMQMLAGQPYDTDATIEWKPSLPESKVEVAQFVTVEDKLGLASKETQATQMGLDWQQEKKRMDMEAEDQGISLDKQLASGGNPFDAMMATVQRDVKVPNATS